MVNDDFFLPHSLHYLNESPFKLPTAHPDSEIEMHYEPVSFKPLMFVPKTFHGDLSTGIACLDKYIDANPPRTHKSPANIRGKLLRMAADAKCPPTIKSGIQKFDQHCQRLSLLSLETPSWRESQDESFDEYSSSALEPLDSDNIEHPLSNHEIAAEGETNGEEDISNDNMPQDLHNEHDQDEESGSVDLSMMSSSDDSDIDAYIEYLYPDTSLHRSQIDLKPLPQVTYDPAPVYFINPFAPSETIDPMESLESFDPTHSSSPKKRRNTSSKAASTSHKKARVDYPSASTSTSSSSFSFSEHEGDDVVGDVLSEFPPGHPKSPFSKGLCKDGGFKYTCRKCPDFSTRAIGDMRRHMESLAHKPKKDHICKYPKCGGSFTRKDALKRHQMSKRHFV